MSAESGIVVGYAGSDSFLSKNPDQRYRAAADP
jgi:hypothetical protein